jgi:hypothetical protein
MAQFQLGSIGTLKPEDLLSAFEHAYVSIYPDAKIPAFFDSLNEHLQSLIEAINYHCPPFVYFGAIEGDGADYGFWPDWDALDAPRPYWDAKRTIKLDQSAKVLIQFDIGCSNVTVMDLDRNVIWSTI